jgi:ATP-binding cassette subfamily F protein uup
MDRLVEHLFVFEGNGIVRDYPGNYTAYREEQEEGNSAKPTGKEGPAMTTVTPSAQKPTPSSKKRSYKEQQEWDTITTRIPELEQKKKALAEEMVGLTDFSQIQALADKIQKIGQELEQLEERWLELEE